MLGFLKKGYQKVKNALTKSRSFLSSRLRSLFSKPWDEATFEELEQILYEADLGSVCANEFAEHVKIFLKKNPDAGVETLIASIRERSEEILSTPPRHLPKTPGIKEPLVILIVGVNGSGKTTSIAKLAKTFQEDGKKVLLCAADTFRAAAIDQLDTWAGRIKVDIVKSQPHADPSAVVFDALSAAKARDMDVVIIDTAGRLQNKTDLMNELEKIKRVSAKVIPNAPHETFLVLDATTGQNAIDQAKIFHQFTPLTGIILAKLDGSAKGGIIIPIYKELGIPVRFIGVGEGMDDLLPFDPTAYLNGLFDLEK